MSTKRSKVPPYKYDNYPQTPNFTPFRSVVSCFLATGHIEASAPNDPKITLNSKMWKVPHIDITTIPESHFHSVSLYGQPFSTYRPFRQGMTFKWHWTLKAQRYPIYIWQPPLTPKFHSVLLLSAIFDLQAILRQVHQMTPKWPLIPWGQR